MKKRTVKSDLFPKPKPGTIIKWLNQFEVFHKYKNDGITLEFLAYNRSAQFRNRKTVTEEDILKVKRFGAAGCLYRNDVTHEFVKRVFGTMDNVVLFENKTPNTPNTSNEKNTTDKIGQKS